ncbi:hypothetical protein CROQUDRAFT_661165 [Cronartium quercuum f. sp. fusiforme G11]|uniref:NADH:ubiquinone oxidoreductase intermediate-associated protein 30 domain-containing protein n=1 Tax=Cronartium quercuum f. sp. fusiforme G11 TaxID=708437 RepID=A0A9P6NH25_9BASI|nr:hypothetical protein CROQUDRAFT_661165 [Cronartium quercuum f. sp. fusiforme G11]
MGILFSQTFRFLLLICLQLINQRSALGFQSEPRELVLDGQTHPPRPQGIGLLFGSVLNPWVPGDWEEVSDTVRGGHSTAHIDLIQSGCPSAGVRFHGTLDTKTLGGAGFASETYRKQLLSFPSERYSGIVLEVGPLSSTSSMTIRNFTFVLKNEATVRGPDGKQQSTISYEFDFSLPVANSDIDHLPALDRRLEISIPFVELRPTYRGRPQNDAKKFNSSHITELSIMCRSFFDRQSGPFDLHIFRIGVVEIDHAFKLQ